MNKFEFKTKTGSPVFPLHQNANTGLRYKIVDGKRKPDLWISKAKNKNFPALGCYMCGRICFHELDCRFNLEA